MPEESTTRYNSTPFTFSSDADRTLNPGDVLGGCVVESYVAKGGMGSVYKARKLSLRTPVALKVLDPTLLAHPRVLSRFLREARVAASLSHPAIVKVFDVGQERGLHYIVMEFIEGRDLRDIIKTDGPMKVKAALWIARQVAEALQYAHDHGVIHRDVKPANILLSNEGQVKLTDLGLARPAKEDTEVTMAGEIIGTPVFMSPEQCRGGALDGRSDLYSLGATLYMVLSGVVPFQAETTPALIHKVVNEPPPGLEARAPHVTPETVALVKRLMAKLPGARHQSGKEVVRAIDDILSGRRPERREVQRPLEPVEKDAKGALRWLGLGLAGVLLGIGAYLASPGEGSSALARRGNDPPLLADGAAPAGANVFEVGSDSGWSPYDTASDGAEAERGDGRPLLERGAINNPALKARVDAFRDAVLKEDPDGILALFPADIRDNPTLHVSLLDFLGRVRALRPRSVQYMASQRSEEEALVTIVFQGSSEARPLGLPLTWVLIDGAWYVRPKLSEESGGS